MSSNINEFLRETNAEIKKLQAKQVSEAKQIVIGAYSTILTGSTAVDKGLYKHSHLINVNATDSSVPVATKEKKSDSEIDSNNNKNMNKISRMKFKHNDSIKIYNNVDYSDYIESGVYTSKRPRSQEPLLYKRTESQTKSILSKRIKI